MGNTRKRLKALNSDSIRGLTNRVNELQVTKEDVLAFIESEGTYYLLYYEDCD